MPNSIRNAALFMTLLAIQACTVLGPDPGEALVGRWQTEVGGFPVTAEYSSTMVNLGNNPPVAYTLQGNELTFPNGGSQVRMLSFPSDGLMIQLDPMTGTEHRFRRLP